MKRVGFILKVKPEKLEEYKRQHEHVWPEMLAALWEAGWHNYSLFVRDDGLLFGYFETPDSLQTAQALMEAKEVNTRWQEFMAPFFESPNSLIVPSLVVAGKGLPGTLAGNPDSRPDQMFLELNEIFHLD